PAGPRSPRRRHRPRANRGDLRQDRPARPAGPEPLLQPPGRSDHPVDHHPQQGKGLSMTAPYPTPADEFADKRVLVTGGTRGIGAAVVRRFQLAGARVAATARSAPTGPLDGAVFIAADIGTAAGADAIVSRLTADWGG